MPIPLFLSLAPTALPLPALLPLGPFSQPPAHRLPEVSADAPGHDPLHRNSEAHEQLLLELQRCFGEDLPGEDWEEQAEQELREEAILKVSCTRVMCRLVTFFPPPFDLCPSLLPLTSQFPLISASRRLLPCSSS